MLGAASVLATRINQLVKIYFTRKLNDQGSQNDEGEAFIDSDFPNSLDEEFAQTGLYGSSPSENDSWHEKVGGPLAKSLLEDIKIILENPLVTAPSDYAGTFFQNTLDIEFFTSGPQFSQLSGKLNDLLDVASEYLLIIGNFGFTSKPDVAPASPDFAVSGPIPTDGDLEGLLEVGVNSKHYIAFLLDSEKSDNKRDSFFLPVRLAPSEDAKTLEKGWDDVAYTEFDQDGRGPGVTGEKAWRDSVGVELPQGLGIYVTEIVESETGTWVGFVFDETDPKFSEYKFLNFTETTDPNLSGKRTRALYTRPEYIRRKVNSSPDPMLSGRILSNSSSAIENAIKIINQALPPGIEKIDPKNNDNWLNLFPEEAVVSYYNFIEHNKKTEALEDFSLEPAYIMNNPALRYSEGYFYFILGEGQTSEQAKEKAWDNLLRYLNKERNNTALQQVLKNDYFVQTSTRVNTNSTSPNNLKALFAIRTGYLDALPDTMLPYGESIDANGPYSSFVSGNNFAFTIYAGKVKQICKSLKKNLSSLKNKISASPNAISTSDGQPVEYDIILEFLEGSSSGDFSTLLEQFLKKQAFPASTKKDFISELIKEAADDIGRENADSKHIIEVGLKDNGNVGSDVRYTISYVLFSPDPEKLKDSTTNNFNLFYYDPYMADAEIAPNSPARRSAVSLDIGLDNLRLNFEGVYGSMLLHYLYSYSSIVEDFPKVGNRKESWIHMLHQYTVPPIKISTEPFQGPPQDPNNINCEALIKEAESFSNIIGTKERIVLSKIRKHCKEKYYRQFSAATPATDPETTKKALELKAKGLENFDAKVKSFREVIPWQVTFLYDNILNVIDVEGIIALIMACIQAKLGIPLTAEAICKSAIEELIKTMGVDRIETILMQNASEDPEKYAALLNNSNPYNDKSLNINETFDGAPIATWMTLFSQDWAGRNPDQTKPDWLTASVIGTIKHLEMGGTTINLVPAERPNVILDNLPGNISFPESANGIGQSIIGTVYGEDIVVDATYSQNEIDQERERLISMGYGLSQANAIMVYNGYLKPEEKQYSSVLDGQALLDPLIALSDASVQAGAGAGNAALSNVTIKNIGATAQDAQNYLDYLLTVVSLQGLCELLVGSLLEGFEDLLQDPAAFLSGGIGNWFDGFLEKLKRKFSFPEPTFRFPDNLKTDTHMDGYGRKLLEMLLTMVSVILGQVLNLIIKDALLKCIEEVDDDASQFANGGSNEQPPIRIPGLDNMLAGNKPKIMGDLPYSIASDLMDDILDALSLGQICSLLAGNASQTTLYNILQTVKQKESIIVSQYILHLRSKGVSFEKAQEAALKVARSTLRATSDIESMFKTVTRQLESQGFELEICNALSPSTAILNDICTAFYDRDGAVIKLEEAGLSSKEANKQIDQDLENLKNKVMSFAPMLFPFGSGVGGSLSSIPDICDIPGAFQVPPGVENAMNLITNNILENVKGSIIQDLAAIKFFAVPPRALLAVSDANEMKKAHSLFNSAVRKPYKKQCIAFIGNPLFFSLGAEDDKFKAMRNISSYPIAYGSLGASHTFSAANTAKTSYGDYVVQGSSRNYYSSEDYKEFYQNFLQENFNFVEEDIFEHEYFRPTSFVKFLGTPFAYGGEKENILRALLAAGSLETYKDDPVINLSDYIRNNQSIAAALEEQIKQEFKKDVKPKYMAEMVFEKKHLINFTVSGLNFNDQLGNVPGYENILMPHPWISSDGEVKKSFLFKEYSLSTPLSSIQSNVFTWKKMFSDYCGFKYDEGLETTIMNAFKYNSGGDDEEEGFPHPVQLLPKEEWSSDGIIDRTSLQGNITIEQLESSNALFRAAIKSPGLFNLIREAFDIKNELYGDNRDIGIWIDEPLLSAFCRLTVGEALGLTDDRISNLFPNFPTMHSVKGVIFGAVMNQNSLDPIGPDPSTFYPNFTEYYAVPLYVVFDQIFVDPASSLYDDPEEMIKHFSAENEPVNPELYRYLTNNEVFPQILGYDDGKTIDILQESTPYTSLNTYDKLNLYSNYNPNILKYDLPFSEAVLTRPIGYASTTFDASQKTQDIFSMFTANGLNGVEEVDAVIERLQIENKENSLVFQHSPNPSKEYVKSQLGPFIDEYRALKGKISGIEEYNVPPGLLYSDGSVQNELFDLNFQEIPDEDVRQLVEKLYDGSKTPMLEALNEYENIIKPYITNSSKPATIELSEVPYSLDATNFKGMLFGKLLASKYMQKIKEYSISNNYEDSEKQQKDQEISNFLQYMFSTHGYSSLNYAYSNQMFAKLKRSRLQERKFMKKLWDKILANTLGDKSGVHPECRQLFDHLNVQTNQDLQEVETDFFRVEDVKKEIIDYYKNSLCRDVYEKNDINENAVRVALMQGIVKLLIEIYSLEMCIASVISWDSFDLADIFDTDIMTNIIISNIQNDDILKTTDINTNKLSILAQDIIKKDFKLSNDLELKQFLKNKSALGYMIGRAGVKISSIIRSNFNNSKPISTDLNLEILKNSDTDFVESYKSKVLHQYDQNSIPEKLNPDRFKQFHTIGGYEYVVDARFRDNIYTMNYGSGHMHDLLSEDETSIDQYNLLSMHQSSAPYKAANYVNIYGFNSRDNTIKNSKSKNFFHSLPYNYYQPSGPGPDNPWGTQGLNSTSDIINSGKFNEYGLENDRTSYHNAMLDPSHGATDLYNNPSNNTVWNKNRQSYLARSISSYEDFNHNDYINFIKINNLMTEHLGRADAYNKENYKHTQIGNVFNGTLGNVVFEPYIKIEDWTVGDFNSAEYAEKFGLTFYVEAQGDPSSLDPCDNPFQTYKKTINDFDIDFVDFISDLNLYRQEENIFNSYMFDFVPLPAWSYFYTEVFLKKINETPEAHDMFKVYGFAPFFKKISFGIRMNYSTTFMIDSDENLNPLGSDFREYMQNSFSYGSPGYIPGVKQVPAWGLKSSKTFFSHRPFYVDASNPENSIKPSFVERYKMCDEIKVPVVEIEQEISCVPNAASFILGDEEKIKQLQQTGKLQENLIPLGEIGYYFDGTAQALDGIEYKDTIAIKETNEVVDPSPANPTPSDPSLSIEDYNIDLFYAAEQSLSAECKNYIESLKLWSFDLAAAVLTFDSNWEKWAGADWFYGGSSSSSAFKYAGLAGQFDALAIRKHEWGEPVEEVNIDWANQPIGFRPQDLTDTQIKNRINVIYSYVDSFGIGGYAGSYYEGDDPGSLPMTEWMRRHPDWDEESRKIIVGKNYPVGTENFQLPLCDRVDSFVYYKFKEIKNIASAVESYTQTIQSDVYPAFDYRFTNEKNDTNLANWLQNGVRLMSNTVNNVSSYGNFHDYVFGPLNIGIDLFDPGAKLFEKIDWADLSDIFTGTDPLVGTEIVSKPVIPSLDTSINEQIFELLKSDATMSHLTKNFHQFFYKKLANNMMQQVKTSPEFKLMYDHLFPMKRYMALSFVMASDSLSKFIPEPADVLEITKSTLSQTFTSVEKSLDYKFLPSGLSDFLRNEVERGEDDTRATNPGLSKQIRMIILRTSFLILKGFVEITDPAVGIAKMIIDASNAVQQGVVAGIETGIRVAKQATQAAKDAAFSVMKEIESNLGQMTLPVSIMIETSLKSIPITPTPSGTPDDSPENYLISKITFDTSEPRLVDWQIEMQELGEAVEDLLEQDQINLYNEVRQQVSQIRDLQAEYVKAETKFNELDAEIQGVIKDLEDELEKAKEEMKKVFQSPYLLPGVWASMLPSMMPYGGGIVPPPFPGGPPSTVAGMIYIVLLFLDAYEESQHNSSQQLSDDVNCEDEL
jgi:hypothetical protein